MEIRNRETQENRAFGAPKSAGFSEQALSAAAPLQSHRDQAPDRLRPRRQIFLPPSPVVYFL
jgi:hypothetical protein